MWGRGPGVRVGRVLPLSDSPVLHICPSPLLPTRLDSVPRFKEKGSVSAIERVRKRKYQNLSAFLSSKLLRESEPEGSNAGPQEGEREACAELKHLLLLVHLEGAGWGQFWGEGEQCYEGGDPAGGVGMGRNQE